MSFNAPFRPSQPEDIEVLLTTNTPPDDLQADYVRVSVSSISYELSQIDARLSELETEARTLKQQRLSLLASRDQHRSVLSVVRRIPPEVLNEIFVHLARSEHFDALTGSQRALVEVCRTWRAVALSNGALWSSIYLFSTLR